MADPQAARATQIRNIEAKTGQSFAQLCKLVAECGLSKVGEQRTMLMDKLGLGYGDANALALMAKQAAATGTAATAATDATAAQADPLDSIYIGAKAPLRALHEHLMARIDQLGPHEKAPKKTYISLRRKKQFAMLGPATKDQLELGLNAKGLPPSPRLKVQAPGGMCAYTVRLSAPDEVDTELLGWLRAAYDAAG